MLLAIDIGNSNIVFGIFEDASKNDLSANWRMNSDKNKSVDDYAVDIIEAFLSAKIDIAKLRGVAIASVVPDLSLKIKSAVEKFFSGKILLIDEDCQELNIEINLPNKREVGADRLINAIAGFHYFGENLIIIDFGTATTFDIVGENGCYEGGVITSGVNLSLKALFDAAAKLPKIEVKKQEKVIGKNTIEAMNSGIYFGYVSLIEGIVTRIEKELGKKMTKIVTGGLAELFKDELEIQHHAKNLTLDGLRLVYFNNQAN